MVVSRTVWAGAAGNDKAVKPLTFDVGSRQRKLLTKIGFGAYQFSSFHSLPPRIDDTGLTHFFTEISEWIEDRLRTREFAFLVHDIA